MYRIYLNYADKLTVVYNDGDYNENRFYDHRDNLFDSEEEALKYLFENFQEEFIEPDLLQDKPNELGVFERMRR